MVPPKKCATIRIPQIPGPVRLRLTHDLGVNSPRHRRDRARIRPILWSSHNPCRNRGLVRSIFLTLVYLPVPFATTNRFLRGDIDRLANFLALRITIKITGTQDPITKASSHSLSKSTWKTTTTGDAAQGWTVGESRRVSRTLDSFHELSAFYVLLSFFLLHLDGQGRVPHLGGSPRLRIIRITCTTLFILLDTGTVGREEESRRPLCVAPKEIL